MNYEKQLEIELQNLVKIESFLRQVVVSRDRKFDTIIAFPTGRIMLVESRCYNACLWVADRSIQDPVQALRRAGLIHEHSTAVFDARYLCRRIEVLKNPEGYEATQFTLNCRVTRNESNGYTATLDLEDKLGELWEIQDIIPECEDADVRVEIRERD